MQQRLTKPHLRLLVESIARPDYARVEIQRVLHRLQLIGQRKRRRNPLLRVLFQQLQDDVVKLFGCIRR